MTLESYTCDLCILQKRETIKDRLAVPFYMEIMILMAWSIWTIRNDWMFKGIDPTVQQCKRKFISEFSTLLHRARPTMVPNMKVWMQSL
uniref:Uncharacterized protein n=1 Tax=Setaria viridis TaxID=4556 RepID=A0A4U6W750_SETVI|nr:hypothetical protein SEVIR_1G036238v2 [Setaria viridis]